MVVEKVRNATRLATRDEPSDSKRPACEITNDSIIILASKQNNIAVSSADIPHAGTFSLQVQIAPNLLSFNLVEGV